MTDYTWSSGDAYDRYIGRWSRPIAAKFVEWLGVPPEADWVEVGCGTGALTTTIVELARPGRVHAYDLSSAFVAVARHRVRDERVQFAASDASSLPEPDHAFDAAVSGLMLNFVPDAAGVLSELRRVVRPGGVVAAYVWDYAEGMQLLRFFWDAAVDLHPDAAELDEGQRFSMCRPDGLRALFDEVGLMNVEVRSIEVPTRFESFDDYWLPFLGGQGPAPGYVASLDEKGRARLKDRLQHDLPVEPGGGIALTARAFAVRAEV